MGAKTNPTATIQGRDRVDRKREGGNVKVVGSGPDEERVVRFVRESTQRSACRLFVGDEEDEAEGEEEEYAARSDLSFRRLALKGLSEGVLGARD